MNDDLGNDPLLANVPSVDGQKYLAPCFLHKRIGAGGMGTVYRGRHTNLDIDVAIKCLDPSLALQDRKFVTRFHREAKMAAAIDHENLIRVYDVGSQNDLHYIVMEYVRGETARERVVRKGPLSENEALAILLGAASALAAAHARPIVHRDIKPDNIMISVDGRVKVADLGLAKPLGIDSTLTQGIMGTPKYMAPEQWNDPDAVRPWTDVWALGATFFFLVAGREPFRGASAGQVFPDVRRARPDLSAQSVELLERCVRGEPERRFAHAGLLLHELRALRSSDIASDLADPDSVSGGVTQTLVSPPPFRPTPTRTLVRPSPTPPTEKSPGATEGVPPLPPAPDAAGTPALRARSNVSRAVWCAVGLVVAASATWWVVDRTHRATSAVLACQDAMERGDLDTAARLAAALPANADRLRADVASHLAERAGKRRQERNVTAAINDLRRARQLAPGSAAEAACTQLEETVRTALLASTTLSLANGSVVGRRSTLRVIGPAELTHCTVQRRPVALSRGEGTTDLVCDTDGPFPVDVVLEHEAQVTATLVLSLVGDVTPPTVKVAEPKDGALVRGRFVVSGTTADGAATVRIGDREAAVVNERWDLELELPGGAQTLALDAVDSAGNPGVPVRLAIVVDDRPPKLDVADLPSTTYDDHVDIVGTTEADASLTIAGKSVPVEASGAFRRRIPLAGQGRTEITIAAADRAGNPEQRTISVERLPRPAVVTVLEPSPENAEWSPVVVVKGRLRPGVRALTIGGIDVPFDAGGGFVYAGQFEPGTIELVAIDADASRSRATVELRPCRALHLEVDPPAASANAEIQVRGRTEAGALVRVREQTVTAGADGRFEVAVTLPHPGTHELIVSAWRPGAQRRLGAELPRTIGEPARIVNVELDTAAALADLRSGDEIEAVDGRTVDAQGLLLAVAAATTDALKVRLRRAGEAREIGLTLWPCPAATARIRAEVTSFPGAGEMVPIFGIEPGVTTRAQVERLGAADGNDRNAFRVQGHKVYCDDTVAVRIVLEGSPLPASWERLGLRWGASEQDCRAVIDRYGWELASSRKARPGGEGMFELKLRPNLRVILLLPFGRGLARAEIKS